MMTTEQQAASRTRVAAAWFTLLLLPPVVLWLVLLGEQKPLYAVAAALALPAAYALVARPEVATLATVFILYTNTADIAVSFHGVPYILGASFILLLTIPLAFYLVVRREHVIATPALPLVVLFGIILMLGAATAPYPDLGFREVLKFVAEGLGVYVLVTNVVRTPETLRRVCWTLLAAGLVMAAGPIVQQATGNYTNDFGGYAQVSHGVFAVPGEAFRSVDLQPRLTGPIGEQNRYGQVMLMLAPIGLFLGWGEQKRSLRLLAMGSTLIILAGMSLSFSRGAAVAVAALVVIMALMRYISRTQILCMVAAVALLLVAMPQYANRIARLQGLWGLISPETQTQATRADGALRGRAIEVMAAVHMFLDHPVTGVGPGMYNKYYIEYSELVGREMQSKTRESHNLFLGMAAETGILGLGCFLGILYITMRDLVRTRRRLLRSDPRSALLATGFLLAIVSYLITGLALHFSFARFFWLIMALAASAALVVPDRSPQDNTAPEAA